jgi:C-terminal processing protease CtpA/Prc
VGSELISINGMNLSSINDRLLSLTSADGFNHSYRLEKVALNFPVKYAFAYGFADNFNIEYIEPGRTKIARNDLKPVSKRIIDKSKTEKKELSFKIIGQGNTSLLTINSFGYYSEVDMFHSFIDSVFKVIRDKKIENLIIDLRGNSGGDPFCASYLWAYLQPEPLPYFEDHYGRYDTLANPVFLPANHFKGQLYTLIDGNGFSTTGHFCGLLKYHHVGKFVGTEMGSTYTCTGNATYPPLDNTGIMVGTAKVMRYTAAVKGMDPRRGILPDFSVCYTQEDLIKGVDKTLITALNLIKEHESPGK